jgi:hypothetical protein
MIGELVHLGIFRDEAMVKKQMRRHLQIIKRYKKDKIVII